MARTKYTVTFPAAKAGDEVTWPNSVKVYADANIDRPMGNGYIEAAAGSFTAWSDAASVTFTRAGTDSVTVTAGSPTGTGVAVPTAASGSSQLSGAYGSTGGNPNQPWGGEPGLGPNLWLSPVAGGGLSTLAQPVINGVSQTITTRIKLQTIGAAAPFPDDNDLRLLFTLTPSGTLSGIRRLYLQFSDSGGVAVGGAPTPILLDSDAIISAFPTAYELNSGYSGAVYLDVILTSGNNFAGGSLTLSEMDIRRVPRARRFLNVGWSNGIFASTAGGAPGANDFLAVDVPVTRADGIPWRMRRQFSYDSGPLVTKTGCTSFPDGFNVDGVAGSGQPFGYRFPQFISTFGSSTLGKVDIGSTVNYTEHINNNDQVIVAVKGDGSQEFRCNVHGGECGRSGSLLTTTVSTTPVAGTSETWAVTESAPFTVGQVYQAGYENVTVTAKPDAAHITVSRGAAGSVAITTHTSGVPVTQPTVDITLQYERGDGVWKALTDGEAPYTHAARRVKITNSTKVYRSDQTTPFANIDRTWTIFDDGTERQDRTVTFLQNQAVTRWFYWMSTVDTSATSTRRGRIGRGTQVIGDTTWWTRITAPTISSVTTASTGGTLAGSQTSSYRLTRVSAKGESLPSPAVTVVVPAGTSTNANTVNFPATSTGQTAWRVYGRVGGSEALLATLDASATSWVDTGANGPAGALPTTSTAFVPNSPADDQLDSDLADWDVLYNPVSGLCYGMAVDRTALQALTGVKNVRARQVRSGASVQKVYHILDMGTGANGDYPFTVPSGTVYASTHWSFTYAPKDPANFEADMALRGSVPSALATVYPTV